MKETLEDLVKVGIVTKRIIPAVETLYNYIEEYPLL